MAMKDSSGFLLKKFNEITGQEAEEQAIVGAQKAQDECQRSNLHLSESDKSAGWKWILVPKSQIGAHRRAFGFRPGCN